MEGTIREERVVVSIREEKVEVSVGEERVVGFWWKFDRNRNASFLYFRFKGKSAPHFHTREHLPLF